MGGRLTPRRRAMIALVVGGFLGWFFVNLGVHLAFTLYMNARGGYVCGYSSTWHVLDSINACGSGSVVLPVAELLVAFGLAMTIAYLLARWVVAPVGGIADVVRSFGPNSLGLRLRPRSSKDETGRLADEIDRMLDRLAEGYEAQRRFASNASHELRTPLATQRALIEVSLAAPLTDEQTALLTRQLLATNERNEKLIEGLLVLAETDRGLMSSAPQRFDIIAGEAVATLATTARERAVTLDTDLAPVSVPGEPPLLERLVTNLVGNAIKYNEPGGRVDVRVPADGVLRVTNTGPVVPPEQVAGLFEPFRRLSGERLEHGGGVGLGLTIARSIVAAHGGRIAAQANPSGGLTVEVTLPTA